MIVWKLKEVIARHDIKGLALADELGMRTASISHLRNAKKMPQLDSDRIDKLCDALSKLAGTKIRFADLYEEVEESAVA